MLLNEWFVQTATKDLPTDRERANAVRAVMQDYLYAAVDNLASGLKSLPIRGER